MCLQTMDMFHAYHITICKVTYNIIPFHLYELTFSFGRGEDGGGVTWATQVSSTRPMFETIRQLDIYVTTH